ncbi:MAG: hypothetical protein V4543_09350, partial [Bacteroidota bacterium]
MENKQEKIPTEKVYLGKLMVFLLPLIIAGLVLELGLSRVKNSYSLKNELRFRSIHANTIILGNSQALKGINPAYLFENGLAVNLANVSQALYYDSSLLINHSGAIPYLQNVVLSLCYTSPEEELWENEPFREYFYYRFMGFEGPHTDGISFMKLSYTAIYTPKISLQLALKGFPDQTEGIDSLGWQRAVQSEISPELSAARIAGHHAGMFEKNIPANMRRLAAMQAYCRQSHKNLIVVVMPVHKTYYALEKEHYKQHLQNMLNSVRNKPGVTVL